jgi:hypothetical protein
MTESKGSPPGWPINNEILVDLGRKVRRKEELERGEQEWLADACHKLSNALDDAREVHVAVARAEDNRLTMEVSPRAAWVLYRLLRAAPRNGLDDDVIDVACEEFIDLLGMREAIERTKAARLAQEAPKKSVRQVEKEKRRAQRERRVERDLRPVEMVKAGALTGEGR